MAPIVAPAGSGLREAVWRRQAQSLDKGIVHRPDAAYAVRRRVAAGSSSVLATCCIFIFYRFTIIYY